MNLTHFTTTSLATILLLSCSFAPSQGNGPSSNGSAFESSRNIITALDADQILTALFPGGRMDGDHYGWMPDTLREPLPEGVIASIRYSAIDTIIPYTQGGTEHAAIVISTYERGDEGERIKARIYLSSLACSILGKSADGSWTVEVFEPYVMDINSDPWFMMPKVEQVGADAYVLRVASVIDMPGMDQEMVDVAYLDNKDLKRILSTGLNERAEFIQSDKAYFDVDITGKKGKVRQNYSPVTKKYVKPGK